MRELAIASQVAHTLTVLSGNDRGTVYELVSGRITIGRGSENTIVIRDDPKVSRQHAQITVGANGAQIANKSDHNKLFVNNQPVESCRLAPGMIVQVGDTKFMFQSAGASSLVQPVDMTAAKHAAAKRGPFVSRPQKGNRLIFYTVVGAVILLVAWMMNQSSKGAKSGTPGTMGSFQSTIKTDQQIVNSIEAHKARAGMNTPQYQEAQRQFLEGFREYEKGQYSRAIESFQACVTLFPRHPECGFYLSLAQNRFQELIQYELNLGSQYKRQQQYSACAAAYRNVMFMVQDQLVTSEQKIYNLARAGHDACIALGGRDN